MKAKQVWWLISIASWGQVRFFGTEQKAEEWRAHKCNWEQSIGHKIQLPHWVLEMTGAQLMQRAVPEASGKAGER
jgi:hypothetical protein